MRSVVTIIFSSLLFSFLFVNFLLIFYNNPYTPPTSSSLAPAISPINTNVPQIHHLIDASQDTVEDIYRILIREYLAPWLPSDKAGLPSAPITRHMLNHMEFIYKGGSFRIRIVNGVLIYRKLVYWDQSYRDERMQWILDLIQEMIDTGMLDENANVDLVIYVGDGPKVSADTSIADAGFPLLSLRTSKGHIDIPIPDPVAYGSNGDYMWPASAKRLKWNEREKKAIFRGRGSCLKMQVDNWHVCNRVRASLLAQNHNDIMDVGIIDWNQLGKATVRLYPDATIRDVEASTNLHLKEYMTFEEQGKYRYVIDLDGGLGSSRKPGILDSGSLLIAQSSPWYTFFEPLLKPYTHYILVDRWLRDLPDIVQWAIDNDTLAEQMSINASAFVKKFLSRDSAMLYMQILIEEYSALLDHGVDEEPVDVDFCKTGNKDVQNGPMGCSQDWIIWDGAIVGSASQKESTSNK